MSGICVDSVWSCCWDMEGNGLELVRVLRKAKVFGVIVGVEEEEDEEETLRLTKFPKVGDIGILGGEGEREAGVGEDLADSYPSKKDDEGVWYIESAVRVDDAVPPRRSDLDLRLECPLWNRCCRALWSEISMDPLFDGAGTESPSKLGGGSQNEARDPFTPWSSGGHISSISLSASPSITAGNSPTGTKSVLFPTTTQQKSATSSSLNGARSLNSFHHFVSASRVFGSFTSYMSITASAPRKNADERLENRSWPAVSY